MTWLERLIDWLKRRRKPPIDPPSPPDGDTSAALLRLVNAQRSRPLVLSPQLQQVGVPQFGPRDPVRLAILADALLDAGCDNEELLCHLRGEETTTEEVRCAGEVQGRGNKGMGYYEYWQCCKCGNRCLIAPQSKDGRCHKTYPKKVTRPLRGPHVRGCWALSLLLNQE